VRRMTWRATCARPYRSVPDALRASQRRVAAVAGTLVEKLAARVGKEQAAAAATLQNELGAVSAGVRRLCDVLDLTPEAFPGRAGVVETWTPEGMVSNNWGAEFTEESLTAVVAALGGGGSADYSGSGSSRDTLAWDTLVNLALWLDEEAGLWWRSEVQTPTGRQGLAYNFSKAQL